MSTSASHSIIVRIESPNQSKSLGQIIAAISQCNGQVGAIDIVKIKAQYALRDITIDTSGDDHAASIIQALEELEHVTIRNVSDRTFLLHLGGKIETKSKIPISNRDELSMAYTPGVARVCEAIAAKPEKALNLTIKKNTIAIVTDGTAVLGLGNIGPLAALPVMEGKAMLLKEFANVDAFPICLDTTDTEEIIRTVKNIAPSFGGINLEDISAPHCFDVEERLKKELRIPVFHDDQHGTAAVTTAAFINAMKITGKKIDEVKVVFNGVGAAGTACKNMLLELGVKHIVGCDRHGAIYEGRDHLDKYKKRYAETTNAQHEKGQLKDVIKGADVFIGVSAPNVLTVDDLKNMNKDPIIFAMANPTPEIMPDIAAPHVAIMATGRSDFPNQINNLLAFPGIFRGALDCQATDINQAMQVAAAYAIANTIEDHALSPDYIVPSVFNADVVSAVAQAVIDAAYQTGVALKSR